MPALDPEARDDRLAINTIRTLTIDAVQAAQSGHPGAAMALDAGRLHAVERRAALRHSRPGVAEPGPVRPVGGARLDASCTPCCIWPRCSAPPASQHTGGAAGRHQTLPAVGSVCAGLPSTG